MRHIGVNEKNLEDFRRGGWWIGSRKTAQHLICDKERWEKWRKEPTSFEWHTNPYWGLLLWFDTASEANEYILNRRWHGSTIAAMEGRHIADSIAEWYDGWNRLRAG